MFRKEGTVDVSIVEAKMTQPKFPKNDERDTVNNRGEPIVVMGDIQVKVQDGEGNTDYWHGELSNRSGVGNSADQTRTELTLKTLQEIGFGVSTWDELWAQIIDDGSIPNLAGLQATATVEKVTSKKSGKEFFNIKYLNALGGGLAKPISKAELMAAVQGGGFKSAENPAPAAPAASAPAAPPASPAKPAAPSAPAAPPAPPKPGVPAAPAATASARKNPYA
jgi:pyruvate/2-oxoglutarate dehydrogenase complex dihydrolipoamide acyltransferase (E2) component